MANRTATLVAALKAARGDKADSVTEALGEVTMVAEAGALDATMRMLRDKPEFRFETLIDLCGVDYSTYGETGNEPAHEASRDAPHFAAVYHLISLANNWRLRVRSFATDNAFPVLPTMIDIWPGANWYEREAFDLYGIMFAGHPDLRRLLTDYGFIGHPFRKDFPITGHVEMRFDPEQARVIYQPVTIEPRVITPRIIREQHYADTE